MAPDRSALALFLLEPWLLQRDNDRPSHTPRNDSSIRRAHSSGSACALRPAAVRRRRTREARAPQSSKCWPHRRNVTAPPACLMRAAAAAARVQRARCSRRCADQAPAAAAAARQSQREHPSPPTAGRASRQGYPGHRRHRARAARPAQTHRLHQEQPCSARPLLLTAPCRPRRPLSPFH